MSNGSQFIDRRLGVYCCGHLLRQERPARLVGRQEGDWQFLCGGTDHSDPGEPYYVSIGVLLDPDPSLDEIANLPGEWEAERQELGSAWIRTRCGARDA